MRTINDDETCALACRRALDALIRTMKDAAEVGINVTLVYEMHTSLASKLEVYTAESLEKSARISMSRSY